MTILVGLRPMPDGSQCPDCNRTHGRIEILDLSGDYLYTCWCGTACTVTVSDDVLESLGVSPEMLATQRAALAAVAPKPIRDDWATLTPPALAAVPSMAFNPQPKVEVEPEPAPDLNPEPVVEVETPTGLELMADMQRIAEALADVVGTFGKLKDAFGEFLAAAEELTAEMADEPGVHPEGVEHVWRIIPRPLMFHQYACSCGWVGTEQGNTDSGRRESAAECKHHVEGDDDDFGVAIVAPLVVNGVLVSDWSKGRGR